ncbi:hypothetical protein C8R45DRAFT_1040312 [Mycena sanguinolenta]|nr:hypothetical protein C8R45DRAFT_1040312 [Mycena sanguinolenta]
MNFGPSVPISTATATYHQHGYRLTHNRDIVRALCALHQYAPIAFDTQHHALAWVNTQCDITELHEKRMFHERNEMERIIQCGNSLIQLLRLDAACILDRNAMALNHRYDQEDLRLQRERDHEKRERELREHSASLCLDDLPVAYNKQYTCYVTEEQLNRLSDHIGGGVRRVAVDMEPPATLLNLSPRTFSCIARRTYDPAHLVAVANEFVQRGPQVRAIIGIRTKYIGFINDALESAVARGLTINYAAVHVPCQPPPPFLEPAEHLKLLIVQGTYEAQGDTTIPGIIEKLKEFQFQEPEVISNFLEAGFLAPDDFSSAPYQGAAAQHRVDSPPSTYFGGKQARSPYFRSPRVHAECSQQSPGFSGSYFRHKSESGSSKRRNNRRTLRRHDAQSGKNRAASHGQHSLTPAASLGGAPDPVPSTSRGDRVTIGGNCVIRFGDGSRIVERVFCSFLVDFAHHYVVYR